MEEQRQLRRWVIKKVAMVWMSEEPVPSSLCMIEDMHLNGMRVSFKKRLPQQQTIKMSFAIGDNNDFFKIVAQILWIKAYQDRYEYGLSFNKIDDKDKERMYQYINNNCYLQFRDNC